MIGGDEADSAHIRGKVVNLVDGVRCAERILPAAQVECLELLGGTFFELGRLEINPAHPVTTCNQVLYQVVPDESARASDEHALGYRFLRR